MERVCSAAREALEKTSSSTKTAFRASSFCSDSTLAPSSPRFPIAAPHRSPEGAAGGSEEEEEGDAVAVEATATADFSLCAIAAAGDLFWCAWTLVHYALFTVWSLGFNTIADGGNDLHAHRHVGPNCQ